MKELCYTVGQESTEAESWATNIGVVFVRLVLINNRSMPTREFSTVDDESNLG